MTHPSNDPERARVVAVFLTALPCYLVGFSCDAPYASPPWWLAVTIGLGPTALASLTFGVLPEAWPCSPVSLFMFAGPEARVLADHTMSGDQRLALSAAVNPLAPAELMGRRVVPHGPAGARMWAESGALHDAVLRVIGFTVCHVEALQVWIRLERQCTSSLKVQPPHTAAHLTRFRTKAQANVGSHPTAHSRSSTAQMASTPSRSRPATC